MDIAEIHERLAQEPLDPKELEALQTTLIGEGDAPGLSALHTIVWDRYDGEIALDGLLRTAEVKARTCGDDAVAGMLYARLGLLHWQKMENPDKAELYFRRVAGRAPAHDAEIREFYVDFYARRGNWRRLEQFLMEGAGNPSEPADILPIKRDLARRAMDADQPQKSIAFWAAVMELSPEDMEAEDTLFGLYHEVQKWHGLIDLLKKRMARLEPDDSEGRVAICHQMIAIYRDHIRSDTKVNATWSQILDLDPGNTIALEALVEQYEKMQRWPDLVRVLQQKISHATDEETLLSLHRRIAVIMMERFSNSAEAIKSHNAILELAPHDREAMGHLKELHEKRRDYANYLAIARREVNMEEDSAARGERFVELARIATEKIRKPEVAIELWEEVLSLHTDHPEALQALEGLFERERNYTRLVDILERRLTIEESDEVRAPLLDKLGLMLSTRIGDANRAAGVFKELLELQPENRKAQNELRKRALAQNDWEELEWLYRNHGTLTELVRTLETRVRGVEDLEEKKRLLFKIADLHREELDEPHRAVSALEQILALDPRNGRAAGRLAPLYSASERWAKLAGVQEIQLGETTDAGIRHDLLVELTDLYENRLGQYEQAFFSWVQVHRERFAESRIQEELERLAERSDNWDTWVAVVEETLPNMDDSAMRVATRMRLATVLRDTLEETDRALRHHQEIIAEDPTHGGALDAMEDIYRGAEEWNFLIGVLKRKEELADDPETSRDLGFQIGTTWRDQLGDNQEAAAVFRALMERSPEDARVLRELSAIYLMEEDYEGLLGILRSELALLLGDVTTPPSAIAEVHCQIGQLLYSQSHPTEQVVDQYRQALEADSDCDTAVTGLEELIALSEVQASIPPLLEPIYRQNENWSRLADILEIRLDHTSRKGRRLALLETLGEIHRDRVGDDDRAFSAWARIFAIQPDHPDARRELEELALGIAAWRNLVDLYEAHVDEIEDDALRINLRQTLADTCYVQLQEPSQAQVHYEALLDEIPDHGHSMAALEAIYADSSQWEALLGIHSRHLAATQEPSEQIDQLRRIEDIQADKLDLVDAAIGSCNAIIGLDPETLAHYRRLDALLTRAERWDELAMNLTAQTTLVEEPEDVIHLQSRLAELQEEQLQDVDSAIETHARILDASPDHAGTIAVLERLFGSPETAESVADLLEPVHRSSGNWAALLAVHEVQKNKAHDPDEQVRYAFAMATLHEGEGGDLPSAMSQYAEALRIQPEREATVTELLRIADALDNHEATVQLIAGEIDGIGDLARQIAVHRTLAEVTENKLNDPSAALGHHKAILDIQPDDIAAADAVIRLHRDAGSWDALVQALLDKAGHAADANDQASLLKEAGSIAAGELGDPERAIPIFETVLANAPEDDSVLDSLEDLYARTERHADIVDILHRKIERSEEDEQRKALARQCASIQEGPLEAPEDAIATHDRILEWDGEDREALDALDRLHCAVGNSLELTGILSRIAALADSEERVDLLLRKGAVLERDIGDERAAVDTYAAVLNENTLEERALGALETIVQTRDEKETAFAALLPVLESNDSMQRAHDLLQTMVEHRDTPDGRIELLQKMASIAENNLENPLHGFDCLGRALRDDPQREDVAEELERIAGEQDHQEALQGLYASVAEDTSDPSRALELHLRVGRILKDRIADPHRAIPVFTALMDDHPDHGEVLDSLDTLHQLTEQWPQLAGILRARIDATTDTEERVGLHFRLATLLEDSLANASEAFESLQEVLFLVPAQTHAVDEIWRLCQAGVRRDDASEILEPIYTDEERWRELEALLKVRLEDLTDQVDKGELLLRLADLNTTQMDSPPEALNWLGKAFILDPDDDHLLGRMEELGETTQGWSAMMEFLLTGAAESDNDRKVELWHKAARVALERHGAPDQAENLMRRILEIDAENTQALEILDTLLTNEQRWEELEPALETRIRLTDYDDDQVALLARLGEIQRDSLERPEDAIQTFRRILAIDESHFLALQSLAALYETSQQWEPLRGIYEILGALVEDPTHRGQLLARLAEVLEQHLERPAEAIDMLEELLLIQPDNRDALHDIQRLLSADERWEDLAEALDREARLLGEDEGPRRLEVHRMLGQLWTTTLDDPMNAQGHWEQVLGLAPSDMEALQSLQNIYRDSGAAESLASVLQTLLEAEESAESEGALGLWRELAELRHTALGQPHSAIDAWEMVAQIEPTNEDALDALEQLHSEQSQWEEAVAIVQRRAALLDTQERPSEATEQLMRAAEIQLNQITNKDAAIALYEVVMEREPGHVDASWQLESLCEAGEDWPRLAKVLLGRVEHTQDSDDVVPTLHKLAKIYEERLEETEAAFLVHQRVLQEEPDDMHSLGEAWRLAASTENQELLANGLLQTIPRMEDEHQQIENRMKLGALLRDHLERDEESVTQFQAILEIQPDHLEALQCLVELYEPMERWEALVEALEALSEATAEYPERIRLMGRVGSVLEQRIEDTERAVSAYKDVLDLDESDTNALNALDRLHTERAEWRALLEVLDLKIQANPREEVGLRLRMGRLLDAELGEPLAAIETFEEILHLDPAHPDALSELENLYKGREDWDGLIAVYERLQGASADPETRKTLARNIALIQEEVFSDPTRAAEAYREMLDADPADTETVAALDRLLTADEAFDELLNVFELHAENISDDPTRMVEVLTRIASLYQERLDDPDNAIRTLERVLTHDESHAASLDALEAHYRSQERWAELGGILDRKIGASEGPEQVSLLCQKAALQADTLAASDDAVTTLRAALDLQPDSREALQTLQRIHATHSRWEDVIAALLLEETAAPEGPETAAVRMRIGRVHSDYLNDPENAIHYLESALIADPGFVDAAEPLARLFAAESRWESTEPLLEILEGAAGDGEDPTLAASRFALIAEAREGLMDPEGAFKAWTQAVHHAPDNTDHRWGMGRIALQRHAWDEAQSHFETLLDQIRESASDAELAECSTALGEIALAQGRDTDATDHLEEAIALQPNNAGAISNLVQMAREHGNWPTVVRYQQELVDLKDDPMERLALQLEIGDIYKEKLEDIPGAVDAWRRALELDPAGRASLGKLLEVHLANREFQDAVEILQRMIDTEEDAHTKSNHTFMLALIHRDELNDDEQAVFFFNETLDLDPSRLEAFQALDDLLTKQQAWKEEERAYRKMIERIADKGNNELEFKLWKALGEIYRLRLKDYEYAISAFHLASEKRPGDVQILEIISELQEKTNAAPEALIQTHRRLVELEPDARINSYRALYKLYRNAGNNDGAWCIASVLNGMGKADDEASSFHQENRTPTMALSSTPVDGDAWSRGILHAGAMDRILGEIFQILFSVLGGSLRAQSLKDLQLQKTDAIDLEDGSMFSNVFRTVAGLLDLQTPVVYSTEHELGIRIENLDPPAIIIGNDLQSGRSEKELAFLVGKTLTYFLPLHLMAGIYSRSDLKMLFLAAMKSVRPDMDVGDNADLLALVAEIDRRVTPTQRETLDRLITNVEVNQSDLQLGDWLESVELSANHAGLLMCNDFEVALNSIRSGTLSMSKLGDGEKLKDLVVYAVSERYMGLRKRMGIALESIES